LTEKITRTRTGEFMRQVFEILKRHPDGLAPPAVLKEVEASLALTDHERSPAHSQPFVMRFEEIVHLGAVAPSKAGWMKNDRGKWAVSEAGLQALDQFTDPDNFMVEASRRSRKGWLAVNYPRFYSKAAKTRDQVEIEYRLLRRVGLKQLLGKSFGGDDTDWQKVLPVQTPQRFVIPKLEVSTVEELLVHLQSFGAKFEQGGHTLYLPPASLRLSAFRVVAPHYPADAGLKIVKTPGGIDDSVYVHRTARHISKLHKRLTYNHRHLSLVANLLYSEEVGPRLYDLVEFQSSNQLWTAYVVRHVEGREPTIEECRAGLEKLRQLEDKGTIKVTIPDGFDDEDFECPACNKNAFVDTDGRFHYIDFQNFLLVNYGSYLKQIALEAAEASHFGDKSMLRGGRYLYQSVPGVNLPGKRDVKARVDVLRQMMGEVGASVEKRLVLDIGCNVGMMLAQYLALGALWCHGWDRAVVTPHTERLLLALGCTRFSLTGGDIAQSQPLDTDVPQFVRHALDGCVISYLAVRGHLGWLDALARIPWSFLIYEGHESDTREDFETFMNQLNALVRFRIATVRDYRDGDSEPRTIAILMKD
jgi:hypothetical protein